MKKTKTILHLGWKHILAIFLCASAFVLLHSGRSEKEKSLSISQLLSEMIKPLSHPSLSKLSNEATDEFTKMFPPESELTIEEYIYVYDIPNSILRSNKKTACDYCIRDPGYNAERAILNAVNSSRFVTRDPSKATWKLVPMFYACMVDCGPYDPKRGYVYARSIMQYVKSLPYWQEKDGRDHIFVFSQDKGAYHIANYDKPLFMEFRKGLFISTLHSFMPGRPEAFIPSWDIVIPAIAMEKDAKPITAVEDIPTKGYYAFWRGGIRPRGLYQFRIAMMHKYKTNEIIHVRDGHSPEYPEELANSRFCLYVPGHVPQRWSGALANIIKSGCLIMMVNDCTVRPFHEYLPWDSFTASMSEADFLGDNGENLVTEFATKRYEEIIGNYSKYRKHLMYNIPPKEGDAFSMIIDTLKSRESQIENLNLYETEQRECKKMIDSKKLSIGVDCSFLTAEELDLCKHGYWIHDYHHAPRKHGQKYMLMNAPP